MGIATHHKGGTVWIKRVVKSISRTLGVPWIGIWSDRHLDRVPHTGRAFLCNWAGHFGRALWDRDDFAALHVIRDPRDILLSGCAYHQVAGPKGEKFLHTPRPDLDGQTYQQHLCALPSDHDRLRFEMTNKHAETLREMRGWPWGQANAVELRYEDLMQDTEGQRFGAALRRMGFEGRDLAAGLQAFWDNSLFGGLSQAGQRSERVSAHVVSGGRLQRWKTEMPRAIGALYEAQFGDDLRALGYETDGGWVDTLPERVPA